MAGLIEELKRRNVFKVGAAYVVLAWLLAQAADLAAETFAAPGWVMKMLVTLLALLLPLVLFFAWAFELTPEGIKKEKDVDRSLSITHETGRKLDYLIIGILLLALGYFAVDKFVLTAPQDAQSSGSAVAVASGKSIAVLPFVNMSDDAGNEYFSDGISEEILNALSKVQELQVAGRTSSFAFKGHNEDLRQIGEALGVDHILEGSVRKAGGKVRITAQLIRVDNGFHMWSESYDRELTDVFAIQDEIANAILVQLKAQLVGEKPEVIATARTNSKAYDLYLLAKQRMYERSRLPLESAAEILDQAIAIDPDYAPAYAQKGIVTLLLSDKAYGAIPGAEAETQAKTQFDKALLLDPQLAEAWAGLGLYHYNRPAELQQGIDALQKALAINPNLIDAANWLQNIYQQSARPAQALDLLEQAVQRDPLYKPGMTNLVLLYTSMGQIDKAVALLERTRPFMPADGNILLAESAISYSRGEIAQGLKFADAALQQNPNDAVSRVFYGIGLHDTQQYVLLAEQGYREFKIQGLKNLGRIEEASILADKLARGGEIAGLFALLNQTDRSADLITYLETHWPDLEAFESDFPANGVWGYPTMVDIAYAYRHSGQREKFAEAVGRIRSTHDSLIAQGLKNPDFWLNEAAYHALVDNSQEALKNLAAGIDGGLVFSRRISDDLPWFKEFEGDPDYEAIQARMIEHLNRERAALGLEPIST